MTKRFKISPGRILISQPGYVVDDPLLTDRQKVFDSDWDFSGTILESGRVAGSMYPLTIPFKRTYPFVPAAIVIGYDQASQAGFPNITGYTVQREVARWGTTSKIYNNRIELAPGEGVIGQPNANTNCLYGIVYRLYGVL